MGEQVAIDGNTQGNSHIYNDKIYLADTYGHKIKVTKFKTEDLHSNGKISIWLYPHAIAVGHLVIYM